MSAGALFPQPFGALGSALVVGVEAGWARGPAGVSLALDAAQPSADGRAGDVSYTVRARELRLALLGRARLRVGPVTPFATAGPALVFVETRESGESDGVRLAGLSERSVELGLVVAAGLETRAAGGAIFAAVELSLANLDQRLTGDSSASAVILRAGYRLPL